MLKILLRRFCKKQFLNKLLFFYKKYLIEFYFLSYTNLYNSNLQICLPKRQIHSIFNNIKFKINSTGYILALSNINLKYYKRSTRSNTGHILYLQKCFLLKLKYIYLYYVNNFNYRQWLFFQKFWTLVTPNILIFQHKKSYNTYYRPVKRLKKRITRLILKNQ